MREYVQPPIPRSPIFLTHSFSEVVFLPILISDPNRHGESPVFWHVTGKTRHPKNISNKPGRSGRGEGREGDLHLSRPALYTRRAGGVGGQVVQLPSLINTARPFFFFCKGGYIPARGTPPRKPVTYVVDCAAKFVHA